MVKKTAPVLDDILKCIDGAILASSRHSLESFSNDWVVRLAVQRALEIISEASRRLPASLTDRHQEIPWRRIRAIGNLLRHEYHAIDDEVVWRIVQDDLPKLRVAVVAMQALDDKRN